MSKAIERIAARAIDRLVDHLVVRFLTFKPITARGLNYYFQLSSGLSIVPVKLRENYVMTKRIIHSLQEAKDYLSGFDYRIYDSDFMLIKFKFKYSPSKPISEFLMYFEKETGLALKDDSLFLSFDKTIVPISIDTFINFLIANEKVLKFHEGALNNKTWERLIIRCVKLAQIDMRFKSAESVKNEKG